MEIKKKKIVSYKKNKLIVPHEGRRLALYSSPFSGYTCEVVKNIDKAGFKKPSSSETIPIIYESYQNPSGKYESKVIKILSHHWFIEFTGNYYLPNKGRDEFKNGVLIQDNPLFVGERLVMNKKELINKLYNAEELKVNNYPIFISQDRSVRFIPFGFRTGEHKSIRNLVENPYIVARYLGRKGNELENSEKLGFVASKINPAPFIHVFPVNREEVGLSSLAIGFGVGGLVVFGDGMDDGQFGCSFAVLKRKK
jgi:hypothetical protein